MVGTIGGGHLEFQAIGEARRRLAGAGGEPVQRYALGPSLGQCCGGVVRLRFERVSAADSAALQQRLAPARAPVALFGGGHVGTALVHALAPLPFALTWIDSRDEIFPADLPANVALRAFRPGARRRCRPRAASRVLIMSFSHAEDLDVVAACLLRQRERGDLAFIGLIGSKTKWATFRHRLRAARLQRERTGAGDLSDRPCRDRRQGAGGDRRQRGGAVAAVGAGRPR